MKTIDVYSQYFEAECEFMGRILRGALVFLQAISGEGKISYSVNVTFFRHDGPEDFAVNYDALQSETVYEAAGRRSKKREQEIMETFREKADALASKLGAKIIWNRPLRDARFG